MTERQLSGVVIAMPTPLLDDEEIDLVSLHRLIDHTVSEGADAIMIGGTMGEGVALLEGQKRKLIEAASVHNAGRVPLLATVSETSTKRCIAFIRAIADCPVDYVVCTTPFYNRFPDATSILSHVKAVAESTDIPVVFYNAPLSTGNPVDVDTLDRILNLDNIAGVKDSSTNFRAFMELLRRYPKNNRPGAIMQGDEAVFDVSLLLGADGVVSGGGVVFIHLLQQLLQAAFSNQPEAAMKWQRKLTEELTALLGKHAGRDWVFRIKNRLFHEGIITNPNVSAPFFKQANA